MDNGNDPPTYIPYLETFDENMISTNSGLSRIARPIDPK